MYFIPKGEMRVFIIESPNPLDLIEGRSEIGALEQICKLLGSKVGSFVAKSRQELETVCKYISTIDSQYRGRGRRPTDPPLVIHLSSHGNKESLVFGEDHVTWAQLFKILTPVFRGSTTYKGDRILIISACGAGNETLTQEFMENPKGCDSTKIYFCHW